MPGAEQGQQVEVADGGCDGGGLGWHALVARGVQARWPAPQGCGRGRGLRPPLAIRRRHHGGRGARRGYRQPPLTTSNHR